MIVRERVLLATPGHRDKDWMPPPTHQQLKNLSHATTKKVLAGEGLRLTSRELAHIINKFTNYENYYYFRSSSC